MTRSSGCLMKAVDGDEPGHLGMTLGQPKSQRAPHRQAADEDPVRPRPQPLVGLLDIRRPLGPARRLHVLGRAAVARRAGEARPSSRRRRGAGPIPAANAETRRTRGSRARRSCRSVRAPPRTSARSSSIRSIPSSPPVQSGLARRSGTLSVSSLLSYCTCMSDARGIMAIDQGTTSSRAIVFGHDGSVLGIGAGALRPALPQPGWVEHDPEEIWATQLRCCRLALEQCRARGSGSRGDRHRQPAGDRPVVGLGDRRAAGKRHRLAVPADGGAVRRARGGGLGRQGDGAHRAPPRSVLQRHQARVAAREPAGRQGTAAQGTPPGRDHRQLPGVAPDRGPAPRDRLQQRLAHHAPRPPPAGVGRTNCSICSACLAPSSPSCAASSGVVGDDRPRLAGGSRPHRRHRRRSAGGALRPGRPGSRGFEEHLRHRLLPARQHRKRARGAGARPAVDGGLGARSAGSGRSGPAGGRSTYALEGSVFMAGGAVQWLRDGLGLIAEASEIGPLAAQVADSGGRLLRPGAHRSRRSLLGPGSPRSPYRAHAGHHPRSTSPAPPRRRSVSRPRRYSTRWAGRRESQIAALRVDGGAARDDFLLQLQADLAGIPVIRPRIRETTALGAAALAGLAVGYLVGGRGAADWPASTRVFEPRMAARRTRCAGASAGSRPWRERRAGQSEAAQQACAPRDRRA